MDLRERFEEWLKNNHRMPRQNEFRALGIKHFLASYTNQGYYKITGLWFDDKSTWEHPSYRR